MAKYTADTALVQGAQDVGRSMLPADTKGIDEIITAGKDMTVSSLGEIQKREQKKVDANDAFTEAANEVELSSGSLGDVLYNDTVDFAQTAKNDYLTALKSDDQKGMMAAQKAMQQRSQFTQQHKAFITDLSKLQKDGDLSDAHKEKPEELDFMTAVLKGNYKVEKNDKGEMVFNVNGMKKTNAEFEDMHILKNYKLGTTIAELNGKNKNNNIFDRNNILNTIAQSLPKNVKEFRAALHDDLGGGESFKKLLEKDKTLDDEVLMNIGGYDPDGNGSLSQEEKNNFINAITNHEDPNFSFDVSKRIMAEKMTDAVRNNHTKYWDEKTKAETAKGKGEEKSAWDKMTAGERNDYSAAKYLLKMNNSNNYSGLLGRKTAAGGTFGGMIKQDSDGKFRLFYNMPANPEKPIAADRENALVLPDDPIARYQELASFFGMGGRFIPDFMGYAKNDPTYTTPIKKEYVSSATNPFIKYDAPKEGPDLAKDMQNRVSERENYRIDFSKPKK